MTSTLRAARLLAAACLIAGLLTGCAGSGPSGPDSYEAAQTQFRSRVQQAWVAPKSFAKTPRALSTTVRISSDATGAVKEVKMIRRSGRRDFDASVVKAVLDASPLPVAQDKALATRLQSLELELGTDAQGRMR
ncbi:MAG TPA: TonB family protein [Plasticicumulans sp.]|uniref:TonB family protein n=1 Tax=Plasticicumulans sp. TaxID=2307179 RepID=UPI002C0CA091|nr:TonB family protein [Plasticicumulans sp.]HMV38100.1 TonB family protein [Plasticicumulans sp.]HMZ11554.1 TonB family protein [Plasticicumulans sp.]HNB90256.1 TonB family protein [Plasticicumulans sp.]HNF65118.1 TonB family protein [Plasticicumulans sp.]HNJ09055.1 TonB family protein [Plasticicumulans sp.]